MEQPILCLTGLLLCIFHAADVADAQLYEWVRTIENPTGSASEFFGDKGSVGFVGGNIIIGAWGYSDGENIETGIAYLFDQEGNLLTTFENPTPGTGDSFGRSVLGVGDNVVIAAPRDNSGADESGSLYIFNQRGELQTAIENPTPGNRDAFGNSLALSQSGFVAASHRDDTAGNDTGVVYQFDAEGILISELHGPASIAGSFFGSSVSSFQNALAVRLANSAGPRIAVIDSDGQLLYEVKRPLSANALTFGNAFEFVDDQSLLVTDPGQGITRGAAYLISNNGEQSLIIENPGPIEGSPGFGESVAVVNSSLVAIAAPFSSIRSTEAGAVFLFDTKGELLQTLTTPVDPQSFEFGRSVTTHHNFLFVGQDNVFLTETGSFTSAVHVYAAVPEPATVRMTYIGTIIALLFQQIMRRVHGSNFFDRAGTRSSSRNKPCDLWPSIYV